MRIIAVVNRKGGSGKSTFAAHVAGWCAHFEEQQRRGRLMRPLSNYVGPRLATPLHPSPNGAVRSLMTRTDD